MPGAISQTFEADLNGTGVLVDITSYVRLDSVEHEWGRTDWASESPRPGVLRFALENMDGRFTPGNTSVYSVGCVQGCRVVWTCGAGWRARTFRMSTPEMSFPTGVKGLSLVVVTAYDSLQDLSRRRMRSMFDETVMSRAGYLFWPLSESSDVGHAADIASVARKVDTNLYPAGVIPGAAFGWGDGVGPVGDDRAALVMWPGAVSPPDWSWAYLTTGADFVDSSSDTVQQDTFPNALPAGSGLTLHANTGSLGLSMWVNPSDTAGYPAFVSAGDTSTTYVILAYMQSHGFLVWRPKAHRLSIIYQATPGSTVVADWTSSDAVPRGANTHIALTHHWGGPSAPYDWLYRLWINGNPAANTFNISTNFVWPARPPATVTIGGAPALYSGIPGTKYGFAGTIANVSIHRSPGVYRSTVQSNWSPNVYDLVAAGAAVGALNEYADARFLRLGALLGREDVAFYVEDVPQSFVLGTQDTAGDSLLDAMCTALRAEGACIDTATIGGVDTVRAWMSGSRWPSSAVATLDVDADGLGEPQLTYETSGVAQSVTLTNKGEDLEVLWADASIPARWVGTSTQEDCALLSTADALQLAQFRSMQGRSTGVVPSRVTVDVVTAKASLASPFLFGLRPAVRVTLSGFPAAVFGYSQLDMAVIGVRERYSSGRAAFELRLAPITVPDGWTDPNTGTEGAWRITTVNQEAGFAYWLCGWTGAAVTAAYTSGATTLAIFHEVTVLDPLTGTAVPVGFSTDAGDYPLDILVATGEVVRITAAPAAPVLISGGQYRQVVTVARGQQGTAAAANAASPGAFITRIQQPSLGGSGIAEDTYATY